MAIALKATTLWVEMSEGSPKESVTCGPQNEVSPEEGIKLALSQGATEVALMLQDEQLKDTYPVTFSIYELIKDRWSGMQNKAMARKLRKGEAVDISNYPTTEEGYYILDD